MTSKWSMTTKARELLHHARKLRECCFDANESDALTRMEGYLSSFGVHQSRLVAEKLFVALMSTSPPTNLQTNRPTNKQTNTHINNKMNKKSIQHQPKWSKKSPTNPPKMSSKWFQKGLQGSKMAPKSVLERSGGHLGLKSQQEPEKARSSPPRPPPLGCQDGGQNPSKSGQKSIKKSMIFCIAFYMASGSILEANLEGFGSQVEGHVDQNRDHMASCWQVG